MFEESRWLVVEDVCYHFLPQPNNIHRRSLNVEHSFDKSMKAFRSCQNLLRRHTSLRVYSTDSWGIPSTPTWSVKGLLSSYPSPTLSNATFQKLYKLSALIPPEEGSPEYENMKHELQEMIRLVEAVRLVDTTGVTVPRRKVEEDADRANLALTAEHDGRKLLASAPRTHGDFYVVESERRH